MIKRILPRSAGKELGLEGAGRGEQGLEGAWVRGAEARTRQKLGHVLPERSWGLEGAGARGIMGEGNMGLRELLKE